MAFIIVVLAALGLCAGSFVNALVWRLRQQQTKKSKDLSIVKGRSVCPNCRHELAWRDLIPLLSWLVLKGRCRYCHKPISRQYPIIEAIAGLVFVLSYLFWPLDPSYNGQWLLLGTWLVSSVGLLALAVYDLRWMILPSRIIYPALAAAAGGRILYLAVYEHNRLHALLLWAFSLVIASGVFLALFLISQGKWIGYGDVRLGLVTGTLLADPSKSLAMLFLASLIGTIVILPSLLKGHKNLATKLPYGPFLIIAAGVIVLFGDSLLNWYKGLIL